MNHENCAHKLFDAPPKLTASDVARILANSNAVLGNDISCMEALMAVGVKPWDFRLGDFSHALAEAHNIRTLGDIHRRNWERTESGTASAPSREMHGVRDGN